MVAKTAVLGIIALLTAGTAVGIMAVNGFGPFGFVSFNVQGTNAMSISITNFYLNLGNLTPGKIGNYTANGSMTVNTTGNYTIYLLHVNILKKVFDQFNVTLTIKNSTSTISVKLFLNKGGISLMKEMVGLSKGTYSITLFLSYKVGSPSKSISANNLAFIGVHPSGERENNENNEVAQTESENEGD
jgi:hypothetical protein